MASHELPVCVVKRFRRNPPPEVDLTPAQSATVTGSDLGSFSLVTGDVRASHGLDLQQDDADLGSEHDVLSSIPPVNLFGTDSDDDLQFQPRWDEVGEYDFNYQPGGLLDPWATSLRRSSCFGTTSPGALPPPRLRTRSFTAPTFTDASALWKPPVPVQKSRASLYPVTQLVPGSNNVPVLRTPTLQVAPSAMPVVRQHGSGSSLQEPSTSMQQAWSEAKSGLIQQWFEILAQMDEASGLFATTQQSAHCDDHRRRVIEKFAPTTLQSYFRIWTRWFDFAVQLNASPFNPAPVFLADFLAEHAHGPLGVATAYYKGLSWMARQAQLPAVFDALQSSVCKAYLHSSVICEKRESAPLPLSFVVYLEKLVISKTTPASEILQLGSLLFLIWSSLRWSDALWIAPDTITIQNHAMFAISAHTKTTNRGMPVACYAYGLMGQQGGTSWAQAWLNVVHQAVHDTKQLYPSFAVDFLLTEVGTSMDKPLFLKPMPRDRGLHLIRFWLCKCFEAHQREAKPEDFHLLGTHSCKTTLLSWAQQLQLPLEQRQLQGHHRSQLNGSVALYSRNDTLPALILLQSIAQRIAEGFRPLRPLLRGGAPSLPDFRIQVPPWKPLAFVTESKEAVDTIPPAAEDTSACAPLAAEAENSDFSEDDVDEQPQPLQDVDTPEEFAYLVNPITKVAHLAVTCDTTDRAFCFEDKHGQTFRTGCGARPNAISGDLIFTQELPPGARLCLRRACAKFASSSE